MLRIGLTGGIGSGKSTVSRLFEARGIPVIDADRIAHELTDRPGPVLEAVVACFGPGIRTPDGRLDRARLREIVFADPGRRAALEAILHPPIIEALRRRAGSIDAPYVVLAIPLLIEKGLFDLCDRVLVVHAGERLRRERVRARDGLDDEAIDRIMASQVSDERRLVVADDVVVNEGDLDALERSVEALHDRYRRLAAGEGDASMV